MKKLLTATAICVAATLLILPLAYGQDKAAPPAQAQQDKVFQGKLVKIDATTKSLSAKGAGDMEMTFQYDDATQIVGSSEKNVQELAGKSGTEVTITYRDVGGKHTAMKIETRAQR
jgi:hypothetical protein